MELQFTSEQQMLRDSVVRFAAEQSRRLSAAVPTVDAVWQQLAQFGWLAIPIAQSHEGIGAGMVEVGIVMEGLGRCLATAPYLSTVVLGAGLITLAASDAQQQRWLPPVAAGELRIALAHENPPRAEVEGCEATPRDGGWCLQGCKLVHDAPWVEAYLVSAETADGMALFLVHRSAEGVRERAFETADGKQASVVYFDEVMVEEGSRLAGPMVPSEALERTLDRGMAAAAAEAVGGMQALLEETVEYTRTRVQFGQPIAANQVARHKLVDMWVACEEARAITQRALLLCEGDDHARAASGARLKVARCARIVAESAVQLHGAMGVTEELDIGHHFKRLLGFELRTGSTFGHHARLAALVHGGAAA